VGATAYTNHPPEPGCFIYQGCQQYVSPYPGEQVLCTPISSNVAVSSTPATTGGDQDSGNFCGTDNYIVPNGSGGWVQKKTGIAATTSRKMSAAAVNLGYVAQVRLSATSRLRAAGFCGRKPTLAQVLNPKARVLKGRHQHSAGRTRLGMGAVASRPFWS
jgi:hypothetical protein